MIITMPKLDRAAKRKPAVCAPQLFARGLAAHRNGQLAQSQALYAQTLEMQPDHAGAMHFLGVIAAQTHDLERAVALIGKSIEINPDDAEAYYNRGLALQELEQPITALQDYDRAITLKPDYAEAYNNCAKILKDLGQMDAALAHYNQAIALKPDFAEAHYNRGVVLGELTQLDAALASYDRAIELRPDYIEAYVNRGSVLQALKQLDAAVRSYDRALALKPDYAEAHWNKGLALLLMGNLHDGWKKYEWRWVSEGAGKADKRVFAEPLWSGTEPLAGKTILLHAEQGLGDTLQFCRYARRVKNLGARVILEVPAPLYRLLETIEGPDQVLARGSALPAFDYQCPLLSLPLAFKTDLISIPAPRRYIGSDPRKVAQWQEKLGARTKPRVGLVWSGSMMLKNDNRSLALADLTTLLSPDYEFVSLQKEVRDADKAALQAHPAIRHFGEALEDFADTAALCELMDVVISVDTSVAHLAGAMGKAVWILLPFVPDWRWLLDRDDSVWYPTARLFRQPVIGDWASGVARVRAELEAAGADATSAAPPVSIAADAAT